MLTRLMAQRDHDPDCPGTLNAQISRHCIGRKAVGVRQFLDADAGFGADEAGAAQRARHRSRRHTGKFGKFGNIADAFCGQVSHRRNNVRNPARSASGNKPKYRNRLQYCLQSIAETVFPGLERVSARLDI